MDLLNVQNKDTDHLGNTIAEGHIPPISSSKGHIPPISSSKGHIPPVSSTEDAIPLASSINKAYAQSNDEVFSPTNDTSMSQTYSAYDQTGTYPSQGSTSESDTDYETSDYTSETLTYSDFESDDGEFCSIQIRHEFIRKVFLIISLRMAITISLVTSTIKIKGMHIFYYNNPWLLVAVIVVYLFGMFAIFCIPRLARTMPWKIILIVFSTLCISVLLSSASSLYQTNIIVAAALVTLFVVISMILFTCQTMVELTMSNGFIIILVISLLGSRIMAMFIKGGVLYMVLSTLCVFIFSFSLVYDTQMIMRRNKHNLSPDDYVTASLLLFMDISYVFNNVQSLLNLVKPKKDRTEDDSNTQIIY